ncbi:hypothetical protein AGDE_16316 [Angomonas deanei]|uniref:Uncharacterized protein n=1 Tax=Angomonas deanei TaxID=59799 RepID=A0A7G2CE88_9TRYP|nr:hypothetical protein AGDE_16316 [Angomonas deanei]CAD2216472.1 hypothetical protein, conserved [Angomonas deanei]|eukprot:EPY17329.1 hypothetical protein AGDE_16316 [Angomonas deanei]
MNRIYPMMKYNLNTATDVDNQMQNEATEENDISTLKDLRANLCFDFLCKKIQDITGCSSLWGNNTFKRVHIILDEAASCPWIYRSVNQVYHETFYMPALFSKKTEFGEHFSIICCSTTSEALFKERLSNQDAFHPVIMGPCDKVYENLLNSGKTMFETNKKMASLFKRNNCFRGLIQNRRCGVLAATLIFETVAYMIPESLPVEADFGDRSNEVSTFFSDGNMKSVYFMADFISCGVATPYRKSNGSNDKPIEKL